MTIERAIDALTKRAGMDKRIVLGSPATTVEIKQAESELALTFPSDLVTWYARVGTVRIDGEPICGVATGEPTRSVVQRTLWMREDIPDWPEVLVVLHGLGNGDEYCLDTERLDHSPIVRWHHELEEFDLVAPSLGAWIAKMLRHRNYYPG